MLRTPCPCTNSNDISSRSVSGKYLPDKGFAERLNIAGDLLPASRNHRVPTGCEMSVGNAAASLLIPAANVGRSCRLATSGHSCDRNCDQVQQSDPPFLFQSAASFPVALQRPVESAIGLPLQNGNRFAIPSVIHCRVREGGTKVYFLRTR